MKTCAMVLLLVALAVPAVAANHDESINGDLSTDPGAPTLLALSVGGNTVIGTTGNPAGVVDRDYITFNIPAGHMLVGLTLHALAPDNIAFASFNAGTTSFVPSGATAGLFLAGIHIDGGDVATNLMPLFVSESLTGNSLPTPDLGPGDYCFLIQQTSPITQGYTLEFVLAGAVPTTDKTWGAIKALYR
ncbi:MAG TPA: hypothetical protein VEC56_03720 [Candidatus Krumholzibacteria bacterium]|nr:hypothetical protein [Candidatus Krumholzibacteria bacterium]